MMILIQQFLPILYTFTATPLIRTQLKILALIGSYVEGA